MRNHIPESIRAPIFAILLFETMALFARSFWQIQLVEDGQPPALAKNLSYLIVPPILLVLLFPVLRQQRHFLARRFDRTGLNWKVVGTAILVGVLLRIAEWGRLIGFGAFGIYRNDDPSALVGPIFSFSCPPGTEVMLYLIVMSLLTPVVEEIINRGFLLYAFLKRGRLFAIALSSFLFAIMHSPETIPLAFVTGLFLAVLALSTGTLWAPLIAHATYNGVIVLDWMCLNGIWNPQTTTPTLVGVGLLALTITALSLYACSRLVRGKCVGTDRLSQRSP